ncbi:MAG TPA: ribose ABC transporter permease [Firmicutes bacterium]|jgi:ribose transport system permease protein|nr:ribose ABC transporter permease [Bacillota bacterium]
MRIRGLVYLIRVKENMKRFTPLISLLIIFIMLTFLSPYFLTWDNLCAIGVQIAVTVILAIGEMMVIISGGIDLSIGSVLALSGIITSVMLVQGHSEELSIISGTLVGAGCGFINGFLISKGKLPPFIVTLGMMGVARGMALVISDGVVISGFSDSFSWWGMGTLFGGFPVPVFLMIVISLIGHLVLRYMRFGRLSYAIGSNSEATRLSGVNVDNYSIGYYTTSGLLAGFAGIVLASRLNTGQPTAGSGYELEVIAACVMGGASLRGGVGTVMGAIIGGLVMGLLRNGSNLLDVSAFWQQVLVGMVIVGAVYWDQHRQHQNSKTLWVAKG